MFIVKIQSVQLYVSLLEVCREIQGAQHPHQCYRKQKAWLQQIKLQLLYMQPQRTWLHLEWHCAGARGSQLAFARAQDRQDNASRIAV